MLRFICTKCTLLINFDFDAKVMIFSKKSHTCSIGDHQEGSKKDIKLYDEQEIRKEIELVQLNIEYI